MNRVELEPAALLSALSGLVRVYTARATPVLKRALAELVTDTTATAPAVKVRTEITSAPQVRRTVRPPKRQAVSERKANGEAKSASRRLDPAWEDLRRQVRERMKADGVGFAELAVAIERTENTTRIALLRRTPPAAVLAARLTGWLANGSAAPAVAGEASGFRRKPASGAAAPA